MPSPVDVSGVRSFMGWAGYHRKFVTNFSNLPETLSELTHANTVDQCLRGGVSGTKEYIGQLASTEGTGL